MGAQEYQVPQPKPLALAPIFPLSLFLSVNISTTIMELGPQTHNQGVLLGPNFIVALYSGIFWERLN